MTKLVEANEPGTIGYQFYLNKPETKCIVHEIYASSDAALAHAAGIASKTILPKIFGIAQIPRFDVYGKPSKELQKVLTSFSNFDPQQLYNLFVGFNR